MNVEVPIDPLIGKVIDNRYKIQSLIARGGMAKVYRAIQLHLNRVVAIKVLDPKHVGADEPEFQKRFELEAQMTSKLNHPNTVTIHDYGFNQQKHFYYFVMEYIKGKTLRRAMKEEGVFTIERTLHIAQQVARSVRQAHSVGIIHRDLKPSNILLTTHDNDPNYVKVVDFGLLKLKKESKFEGETTEATLMGSPRYMSPEQIRRTPIDHRSDIYSLGVNVYQMLAGKPPFTGSSAVQILMGHLNRPVPPLKKINPTVDVPPEVEKFTMKCLKKKPDERYQNMDEVIEAIDNLKEMSKKAGAYTSVPTSKKEEIFVSEKPPPPPTPESREKKVEDIPPQPSHPSAWSDSVTSPPQITETQSERSSQSIPIDIIQPPTRKKLSLLLIGIVSLSTILVAGVIGITLTIFMGKGEKPAAKTHRKIIPDEKQSKASPTIRQKEDKKVFKLKFDTTPEGAFIFEGENNLCITPCEVEWIVKKGEEGKKRDFTVVKEGFEIVEISQTTPHSNVTIGIPLTPITEEKTGEKVQPKTTQKEKKPYQEKAKAVVTKEKETKGAEKKKKVEEKEKSRQKKEGGLKLIDEYPDL